MNGSDPVSRELRAMVEKHDPALGDTAISYAFGTPKPTLANSYRPQLLRLRTFPTLMGYSSRIMAESWESNTLYWAALADQLHIRAGAIECSDSDGRNRWWNGFSHRIWRIGRHC